MSIIISKISTLLKGHGSKQWLCHMLILISIFLSYFFLTFDWESLIEEVSNDCKIPSKHIYQKIYKCTQFNSKNWGVKFTHQCLQATKSFVLASTLYRLENMMTSTRTVSNRTETLKINFTTMYGLSSSFRYQK